MNANFHIKGLYRKIYGTSVLFCFFQIFIRMNNGTCLSIRTNVFNEHEKIVKYGDVKYFKFDRKIIS